MQDNQKVSQMKFDKDHLDGFLLNLGGMYYLLLSDDEGQSLRNCATATTTTTTANLLSTMSNGSKRFSEASPSTAGYYETNTSICYSKKPRVSPTQRDLPSSSATSSHGLLYQNVWPGFQKSNLRLSKRLKWFVETVNKVVLDEQITRNRNICTEMENLVHDLKKVANSSLECVSFQVGFLNTEGMMNAFKGMVKSRSMVPFIDIMENLQRNGYRDVDFDFVASHTEEGGDGKELVLFTILFRWNDNIIPSNGNDNTVLAKSLWDEGTVNEVVADSLTKLYRAFRKAKTYAKREYPDCDFCQVDYDKVLKKAVVYIKQLPVRIDYVNDNGCMKIIPGVGIETLKRIHLVLGSAVHDEMVWKCTWKKLKNKHGKNELINIDIEWVELDENESIV